MPLGDILTVFLTSQHFFVNWLPLRLIGGAGLQHCLDAQASNPNNPLPISDVTEFVTSTILFFPPLLSN